MTAPDCPYTKISMVRPKKAFTRQKDRSPVYYGMFADEGLGGGGGNLEVCTGRKSAALRGAPLRARRDCTHVTQYTAVVSIAIVGAVVVVPIVPIAQHTVQ